MITQRNHCWFQVQNVRTLQLLIRQNTSPNTVNYKNYVVTNTTLIKLVSKSVAFFTHTNHCFIIITWNYWAIPMLYLHKKKYFTHAIRDLFSRARLRSRLWTSSGFHHPSLELFSCSQSNVRVPSLRQAKALNMRPNGVRTRVTFPRSRPSWSRAPSC